MPTNAAKINLAEVQWETPIDRDKVVWGEPIDKTKVVWDDDDGKKQRAFDGPYGTGYVKLDISKETLKGIPEAALQVGAEALDTITRGMGEHHPKAKLRPDIPSSVPEEDTVLYRAPSERGKEIAENIKGTGEAAATLASGMASFIPAGVAGYIEFAMKAAESKDFDSALNAGLKAIEQIGTALTYQPETESGKKQAEIAVTPIEMLNRASKVVGDIAEKATGSPDIGAGVATLIEASVYLGLPMFGKYVGKIRQAAKDGKIADLNRIARELAKEGPEAIPLLRDTFGDLSAERPVGVEGLLGEKITPPKKEHPFGLKDTKPSPGQAKDSGLRYGDTRQRALEQIAKEPNVRQEAPGIFSGELEGQPGVKTYRIPKEEKPLETPPQSLKRSIPEIGEKAKLPTAVEKWLKDTKVQTEKRPLKQSILEEERGSFSWEKLAPEQRSVLEDVVKKAKLSGLPTREYLEKAGLKGNTLDVLEKYINDTQQIDVPPTSIADVAKPSITQTEVPSMLGGEFQATQESAGVLKQNAQALHDWVDVEAKWKRIGAPETGFHVKNIYSVKALHEDKGLIKAKENAKLFGYKKELAPEVVLGAENPKYFASLPKEVQDKVRPAVEDLQKYFIDSQKEYADRGVKVDFRERIVREIEQLLVDAEPSEIPALEKALSAAKEMNFVHIPSAFWFESFLKGNPGKGAKVLSLLATQKRKTLRISDLIEREIIDKADVHPADIIASYARRKGHDFAMLDIVEGAVKDGLASKEIREGLVKLDARAAPMLRGYNVHPALAEWIYDSSVFREGKSKILKAIQVTKGLAFYNPFFLPMYDVVQATMAGAIKPAPKTIKAYYRGAKDAWKKTPEYYTALEQGLASQPFNNPFGSYTNMVEKMKQSPTTRLLATAIDTVSLKKTLPTVYSASWNLAWQLDRTVRMGTYHYLKELGHPPREAAQIAAKFHADYASVPAKTRQSLNAFFFTPTFKIVMGKLFWQMTKDAGKAVIKLGNVDKTVGRYGKGLLYTAAVLEGYDLFMTELMGFQRDEYGRRYIKEVESKDGPKELVITWSTPANMFLKYIYRTKKAAEPGVDKGVWSFLEMNKWELTPVLRVAYETAMNQSSGGEPIWEQFDDDKIKMAKAALHMGRGIVQMSNLIKQEDTNEDATKAFRKDYGTFLDLVSKPFTFKYLRNTKERRGAYKVKQMLRQLQDSAKRGKMGPTHLNNFLDQLEGVIEDMSQ